MSLPAEDDAIVINKADVALAFAAIENIEDVLRKALGQRFTDKEDMDENGGILIEWSNGEDYTTILNIKRGWIMVESNGNPEVVAYIR